MTSGLEWGRLLNEAVAIVDQLRDAGHLGEAQALCRTILNVRPNEPVATHALGLIAYQAGRLAEAIAHLRRAIELAPDAALFHANLGEMYRVSGNLDVAISHARRALEIDPNHAGALINLGAALYDQENYAAALECFDRALKLAPDFAGTHTNRGNALRALKRLNDAEGSYRRALELNPSFAPAWKNLGSALRDLNRTDEAVEAFRAALTQAPNDPETIDCMALAMKAINRVDEATRLYLQLANVLLRQRKINEAAITIEHALALLPGDPYSINMKGRVAFERGDLETALNQYRRALRVKPDLADAHNDMGNALKELGRLAEARDAFVKALELDPGNGGFYLNLAVCKRFVEGDPHLAAMRSLDRSGSLSAAERIHLDFALGKAYADVKDYARAFEHLLRGNAQRRAQIAYDEADTLALFDRAEALFTPGLIKEKSGCGERSPQPIFIVGMPRSGTSLVEQILASHPLVHGAGELTALREVIGAARAPGDSDIPYSEIIPAPDPASLKRIGARYLRKIKRRSPGRALRITDKMPSNFLFIGYIHLALPNARIIHTIRDPIDTCVSCFSTLFTENQNHTYHLAELGRYYRRYQALMAHWHSVLPPGRILDVHYEDVVGDLEGQSRRIISHCGLEWDNRCLTFYRTDRSVRTASAAQVRQPIYSDAIGRGRAYQPYLGPLVAALGIVHETPAAGGVACDSIGSK